MKTPIFIDSDNALGSSSGDIDDAFAITALLTSKVPILGIGSIFGNTGETHAYENNQELAKLLGHQAPVLHGARRPGDKASESSRFIRDLARKESPFRILAIGPLTNLALALDGLSEKETRMIEEVIIVGSNLSSKGHYPPFWPFEFNLTKDRWATQTVFSSALPLTFIPLDVARKLRVKPADLNVIPGPLGERFRTDSERWFARAKRRYFKKDVPIWDLVAAMYTLEPELFELWDCSARMKNYTRIVFSEGGSEGQRPVRVIRNFDPQLVWKRFTECVGYSTSNHKE